MPTKKQIENVIAVLNEARAMEIKVIVQYMNQHYGLDSQDFGKLASAVKKIAIDEMKHAEAFAERIKEIDSTQEPTTKPEKSIITGQVVGDMFSFDAETEEGTIEKYGEFAKICRDNNDPVSAVLFDRIAVEEQDHLNYFSNTAEHIKSFGNCFLNQQISK